MSGDDWANLTGMLLVLLFGTMLCLGLFYECSNSRYSNCLDRFKGDTKICEKLEPW